MDDILESNAYCTIATVCEDGSPWSTPVFFARRKKVLYWWSPRSARHSQNIFRDGRVFVTVFNSSAPEGEGVALYMRGVASEVSADELPHALEVYNSKACKFLLTIDDCTGDAPTRMYKMSVDRVWINDEGEENGKYIDIRRDI